MQPPTGHGRCAPRTVERLPLPSRTWNGKKNATAHWARKVRPRAPSNDCPCQAELGTRKRMQPPLGHGRCAPAHRRTIAPTKPNLEREKECNRPSGTEGAPPRTGERLLRPSRTWNEKKNATAPRARKVRPRAPANDCSDQAELGTRKRMQSLVERLLFG